MKHDNQEPSNLNQLNPIDISNQDKRGVNPTKEKPHKPGILGRILGVFSPKTENNLRDALEEYIEDTQEETINDSASTQERAILRNILNLRDIKVMNVMIPRADIVAISEETSQDDLLDFLSERQFSRLPVYRENLDDILGTIHIKDILEVLAQGKEINIPEMINETPIVSPSMDVFDLILEMRKNRRHMAFVVDEHGGIDGLVTIGDVIESIVGDIHDEHDNDEQPKLEQHVDGSITADARVDIEDFEEQYGTIFTDDEREESDTLGGAVCDLAGRVPDRGEILTHDNGTTFEIIDADPRRVSLLKISNIPNSLVS